MVFEAPGNLRQKVKMALQNYELVPKEPEFPPPAPPHDDDEEEEPMPAIVEIDPEPPVEQRASWLH